MIRLLFVYEEVAVMTSSVTTKSEILNLIFFGPRIRDFDLRPTLTLIGGSVDEIHQRKVKANKHLQKYDPPIKLLIGGSVDEFYKPNFGKVLRRAIHPPIRSA